MKLLKKILSVSLAIMMISSCLPMFGVMAEGKYVSDTSLWMYPSVFDKTLGDGKNPSVMADSSKWFSSVVHRNGQLTYLIGRNTSSITYDSIATNRPSDYNIIRQGLGSSYTNKTGIEYSPKLSDTQNPYYELYVDVIDHSNNEAVALTLEVTTEYGVCRKTIEPLVATSGFLQETRYMGTVKLASPEIDKIAILLPLGQSYTDKQFISVGGVMLKQLATTEEPEDCIRPDAATWLYPRYNGTGIATAGNSKVWKNSADNTTISARTVSGTNTVPEGAPAEYAYMIRQGLSKADNKPTGIEYTPGLTDTNNSYYAVYVNRIAHGNTNDVPLNMVIYGDDGEYVEEIPALGSASGWNSDMYFVGNVKLSQAETNRIGIFLPLDRTYSSETKDYFTVGPVKLVQLRSVPEEVLTPVAESDTKWMAPFSYYDPATDISKDRMIRLETSAEIFDFGWSRPMSGGVATGLFDADASFNESAIAADASVPLRNGTTHYVATAPVKTLGQSGVVNTYTGIIYKPRCTDTENPYWTVYYENVVAGDGTDFENLHLRVCDENGYHYFNMGNGAAQNGPSVEMVKLGTFKFTNADTHRLDAFLPAGDYSESDKIVRIGGFKIVKATEADAAASEFLMPVYGEEFDREKLTAWDMSENTYYMINSDTVNMRENGATFTLNYEENAESNNALLFNDGIMDMELVWRGNAEDEYASMTFVRGEGVSSELRIYNSKVVLVDNGNEEAATEFLPFAEYALNSAKNKFSFATQDQEKLSDRLKRLRIDICDAPNADGGKILKVYIASRTASVVPMAMGLIPANSPLIAEDADVSDNKLIFKNCGTHPNGFDLGYISVAVPDASVTSEGFVFEEVTPLTVTDTTVDGAPAKNVSAKIVAYYTAARTAQGQMKNEYERFVPGVGVYDANNKLCAPADLREFTVLKGGRGVFEYSQDVPASANPVQAKYFKWSNMAELKPVQEATIVNID